MAQSMNQYKHMYFLTPKYNKAEINRRENRKKGEKNLQQEASRKKKVKSKE